MYPNSFLNAPTLLLKNTEKSKPKNIVPKQEIKDTLREKLLAK